MYSLCSKTILENHHLRLSCRVSLQLFVVIILININAWIHICEIIHFSFIFLPGFYVLYSTPIIGQPLRLN
jgi:hypothetical protein